MKKLFRTITILIAMTIPTLAQQVEKLNVLLSTPTTNTDRKDGYQYEARGNVFEKQTKVGRYLLRIRYNRTDGTIATFAVTIAGRGTLVWDSFFKYELEESEPLSFSYEGKNLKDGQRILTEYTPLFPNEFGGKLSIWFLNE